MYLVRELPTEEHPVASDSYYALKKVCPECVDFVSTVWSCCSTG